MTISFPVESNDLRLASAFGGDRTRCPPVPAKASCTIMVYRNEPMASDSRVRWESGGVDGPEPGWGSGNRR